MDKRINTSFFYNQCFSPAYINEFVYKRKPYRFISIVKNLDFDYKTMMYKDIFDYIYDNILRNNRYAYYYKNEIYINHIKQQHDINHCLLTEILTNKAKIDMLIINGTTTAYEIKSEFDSTERLYNQLSEYIKVFDNVYVICSDKNIYKIKKILNKYSELETVGLKFLHNNNLHEEKRAYSGISANILSKEKIFGVLNSSEVIKEFGEYNYNLFMQKSINECHDILKKYLPLRNKISKNFLYKLPKSLLVCGTKMNYFNIREKNKLLNKLNMFFMEE